MFNNKLFKKAIDDSAQKAEQKLINGQSIEYNDAQALLVKSQMDYINYIDQDLRKDIANLDKKFEQKFDDIDKKFDSIDKKFDSTTRWFIGLQISTVAIILTAIKYL